MDAGHLSRHVLLLHGGASRGALVSLAVRSRRHGYGRDVLAFACVGWLLFFIHHISQAISVNHIVDRIASETEAIIDEFDALAAQPVSSCQGHRTRSIPALGDHARREPRFPVISASSTPVRLVDSVQGLPRARSTRFGASDILFRPDVPLLMVIEAGTADARSRAPSCRGAFDLGPTRTLQQDVEFGVLQIVDIALKAISPAVNDPTTRHQLRRSVEPHHDPLCRPRTARVSLLYDPPGCCA